MRWRLTDAPDMPGSMVVDHTSVICAAGSIQRLSVRASNAKGTEPEDSGSLMPFSLPKALTASVSTSRPARRATANQGDTMHTGSSRQLRRRWRYKRFHDLGVLCLELHCHYIGATPHCHKFVSE